ncbi:MAG: GNAT family N-acetyltransferase [Bowdeniella nasicola]|nr:GNAT family N-acetyltransferase [Bowdeniella nasicola]
MPAQFDDAVAAYPLIGAYSSDLSGGEVNQAGEVTYLGVGAGRGGRGALLGPRAAELTDKIPADISFLWTDVDAPAAVRNSGMNDLGDWYWLACRGRVEPAPGTEYVQPLDISTEDLQEVQDRCNPNTHVRPGDEGLTWWGYHHPDGTIAGLCALLIPPQDNNGPLRYAGLELAGLGVDPTYRRQGIGAAMMSAITAWGLARFSCVHYGVWPDNEGALRIYYRLGYRQEQHVRGWAPMPLGSLQ